MPTRHTQQRVLGAQHWPDHVGSHQVEQAELGHVFQAALRANGTSVVYQCRYRPKLMVNALEQLDDLVLDTGIGTHGNRFGTALADLGKDALGCLIVSMIIDADTIALLSGKPR